MSLHVTDSYVPSQQYDREKVKCDPTKYHLKCFQRRQAGINDIAQSKSEMSGRTVYVILIPYKQKKDHLETVIGLRKVHNIRRKPYKKK